MIITDEKNNRVVVPPMKITDVPYYSTLASQDKEYRAYKLQFQAPPNVGYLSWKIHFVSDTFVGEEVTINLAVGILPIWTFSRADFMYAQLDVEDFSALNDDEKGSEDEISEPEEDSLAGQMAVMRGGKVKKQDDEDESDDESGTDDDESSSDSSSDSD
jgi:translocation protein SEC63